MPLNGEENLTHCYLKKKSLSPVQKSIRTTMFIKLGTESACPKIITRNDGVLERREPHGISAVEDFFLGEMNYLSEPLHSHLFRFICPI